MGPRLYAVRGRESSWGGARRCGARRIQWSGGAAWAHMGCLIWKRIERRGVHWELVCGGGLGWGKKLLGYSSDPLKQVGRARGCDGR